MLQLTHPSHDTLAPHHINHTHLPLSHYTARAFTESLGPDTSEAEALRLLASCEE